MLRCRALFTLLALMFTASCERSPGPDARGAAPAQVTNLQVFQVKGVIRSIDLPRKQIDIKHEEIPGYMPAMTMPFEVKDTNELAGLAPGATVSFRLNVTATGAWIDQVRQTQTVSKSPKSPPDSSPPAQARNIQPLGPGDLLPEYYLTNQFGRRFSTAEFKGQALAITFLFTRCPLPTFCPRMATNFEETQQKLLSRNQGPTNWHLLTISFDPEFDTPAVLKTYAEARNYSPRCWTFATGAQSDITAMGAQFGLAFWRDQPGAINHNLRTAVIEASGRVQKIFEGNTWTSDELVSELLKAAGRKSYR